MSACALLNAVVQIGVVANDLYINGPMSKLSGLDSRYVKCDIINFYIQFVCKRPIRSFSDFLLFSDFMITYNQSPVEMVNFGDPRDIKNI